MGLTPWRVLVLAKLNPQVLILRVESFKQIFYITQGILRPWKQARNNEDDMFSLDFQGVSARNFCFLCVKDKMDIIDLETDSDSDIPEPSEDMQFRSVKEEPLETSSSEMSDSDSKKELEVSPSLLNITARCLAL